MRRKVLVVSVAAVGLVGALAVAPSGALAARTGAVVSTVSALADRDNGRGSGGGGGGSGSSNDRDDERGQGRGGGSVRVDDERERSRRCTYPPGRQVNISLTRPFRVVQGQPVLLTGEVRLNNCALAGVTVQLYRNNVLVPGASTVTNASGQYSFTVTADRQRYRALAIPPVPLVGAVSGTVVLN